MSRRPFRQLQSHQQTDHVLTTRKGCLRHRIDELAKAMVVSFCDTRMCQIYDAFTDGLTVCLELTQFSESITPQSHTHTIPGPSF